jgi:hypothetical protein|tara:strand:+ start:10066 stop:10272 length:207 start_codon:yes stop_codon:yes gene_type:complete
MTEPIMPTTEDVNAVLNSNPTAQMQLQIQMLTRVLQERDVEIASLKEELESKNSKNGTGSTEKLEKVT